MSKERLEEIKELIKKIESILYDEWQRQELTYLIESLYYDDHIGWLINRVEELEEERDEWKDTAQSYYMTNQELREQNKRYREALNTIITLWIASTDATDDTQLAHEMSETARQALEGEE